MHTRVPQTKRSEIVAMIARGDKTTAIAASAGVSVAMVSKLRKEEAGAIQAIQDRIQDSKAEVANRVLSKTNQLLEARVDQAVQRDRLRVEYAEQLVTGKIDRKKYNELIRQLPNITTAELTSLSREMFSQSAKADDAPKNSTEAQKQQLLSMLEQIKEGNEVVLERMVFNPHDVPNSTP